MVGDQGAESKLKYQIGHVSRYECARSPRWSEFSTGIILGPNLSAIAIIALRSVQRMLDGIGKPNFKQLTAQPSTIYLLTELRKLVPEGGQDNAANQSRIPLQSALSS